MLHSCRRTGTGKRLTLCEGPSGVMTLFVQISDWSVGGSYLSSAAGIRSEPNSITETRVKPDVSRISFRVTDALIRPNRKCVLHQLWFWGVFY